MKRRHAPSSLDHWDFCEDLPVTQCFDPRQAELLHSHFFGPDVDLFKPPIAPLPCFYGKLEEGELEQRGILCDDAGGRARGGWRSAAIPKAVDEDLYKIPPELLYRKKNKRRIVMGDFLKRCLGLICIT